jgi:hypothetical protein
MNDAQPAVTVHRNDTRHRFEALVDGRLAGQLVFRPHGDVLDLVHTEVDPAFEGQGVGSALVRQVLDQILAAGGHIIPSCPYVQAFLRRHPDYQRVVAPR